MPFVAIDHTVAFAIDAAANSTLFGTIRTNFDDHESRIGTIEGNYVNNAHNHTGGANGPQIGQGGLKTVTTSGSYTDPGGGGVTGSYVLTGGTWSMWTASCSSGFVGFGGAGDTPAGTIGLYFGTDSATFYVDERYFQASPPYRLGNAKWGHFFYLLRKVGTGEVMGTCEAPDPTWAYNGKIWLPDKNDPQRILAAPHPFADYWDKDPAVDGLEVVLVDLRSYDVDALKLSALKTKKRASIELARLVTVGAELPLADLGLTDPAIAGKLKMKIRRRA